MLILTVIDGPERGRRFELPENEPQMIGRSSESLPIADTTVSRRHAELTPDAGEWYLRDLDSQNGTYINGQRLDGRLGQRIKLLPGDRLRVGSTVMIFGDMAEELEEAVRVVRPTEMDVAVEHAIRSDDEFEFGEFLARDHAGDPTADDSVIMAEPDPAAAAREHLRIIYELTTLTSQAADRRELLKAVLELVFHEFQPERGFIMLREPGGEGPLRPAVVKYSTPPSDKDAAKIHVSRTILQHAIKESEGVLATNAMTDPRFQSGDSVQSFRIRSAVCSPVRVRGRVYGAIYIDSSMANFTFTKEQLALLNAIGRHTGLALANADLLHEKLQAERLAAMGEAVASLSHSIKNILQGLRGGADVVEMGLKKSDLKTATGGWDVLKRNLNRIIALTLNMLAYSRQRVIELDLIKLGGLVEECAELLEQPAAEKDVAVIVDADPEMPPVPVDSHLLHQALLNLIGNAVDASPQGGVVTVRVRYEVKETSFGPISPEAVIEILDTGPGVPESKRAWIFEPFNSTKGLRGTGLGLAVTKRIVEDHRGTIRVDTGETGSESAPGAKFELRIPAEDTMLDDPSATTDPVAEARSPGDSGITPL